MWAEALQAYKEAQAQRRRQLWFAASTEDSSESAIHQAAFAAGGENLPDRLTLEQCDEIQGYIQSPKLDGEFFSQFYLGVPKSR
jgi:hypothetical protein